MRLLAALLALLLCGVELAAGPLVDALKARQARVDAVFARSKGEPAAAERRLLDDALTGLLAFDEMAKDALGAEWARRTPAERASYTEAFTALLRASLLRKPDIFRVERVDYGEEKTDGASGSVHTVVRAQGATTEVDYTLRRLGNEWRIVDYAIDGVSTVRNYRSQFARILARDGWDGLLARIRKRVAAIQSRAE